MCKIHIGQKSFEVLTKFNFVRMHKITELDKRGLFRLGTLYYNIHYEIRYLKLMPHCAFL